MKRIIIIGSLVSCALLTLTGEVQAQSGIEQVLKNIEANNKELQANAQLITSQKLEAKTDNNLPDPTLSYAHLWGAKDKNETIGELVVSQSFDFPSLYATRNKLNRLKAGAFDSQADVFRQEKLLLAKEVCLDIIMLRQQKHILEERLRNAEELAKMYAKRLQTGDANALETNKINLELLNVKTETSLNETALRNKLQELNTLNGNIPVVFEENTYPATPFPADYQILKSEVLSADRTLMAFNNESLVARKQIAVNKSQSTLAFPLAPRNLTTVGLTAEWIVFSGGKRIRAGKIGNAMIDIARENREQTDATQRVLLAESYFGLRLAQEVVRVRQDTYNSLKRHYENALKLEAAGMIDKAGCLFAQVNMDEAQRSLEASQKETAVLQNALRTLLNITDTCSIQPVSPLFINAVLPAKEEFLQTMQTENYTVNQLQLQSHIAKQQLRIEQSGYLPDIAVFGKQTLYAHGIQSNLIPRTMIGVGFTWNLFDGLAREKRIRQSKIAQQTLSIGQEKAKDDLSVGIDKLYTQMQKAQDNVRALNTTIELSEELVRIRKKSFTEGMATSTEVIDSETMLATVRVARLAAYYEYDVALMNLLALCGTPEEFGKLSKLRIKK